MLDTVVPALSDWAKTSAYFAQLQLSGTVDSGPKENQQVFGILVAVRLSTFVHFTSIPLHQVDELYGFYFFDQKKLEECHTKMLRVNYFANLLRF